MKTTIGYEEVGCWRYCKKIAEKILFLAATANNHPYK